MCDSKAEGGRRCPASQPGARRTHYAEQKVSAAGESMEKLTPLTKSRGSEIRAKAAEKILDLKSNPEQKSPELDEYRTLLAKEASDAPSHVSAESLISEVSVPDGGATWSPKTSSGPSRGFCYSPYPERSVELGSSQDLTVSALADYIVNNDDLLSSDNHYVGLWNDPATGKVYLDVSVAGEDASEARKACEEKDQIAFFDLQRFESVLVDSEATSGQ